MIIDIDASQRQLLFRFEAEAMARFEICHSDTDHYDYSAARAAVTRISS